MGYYLERYLQIQSSSRHGIREAKVAYTSLVSFGHLVRDEPIFTDAQAVARTLMSRAQQNIQLLNKRLHEIGYRFVETRVIKPPSPLIAQQLDSIEKVYGQFPLTIRAWFEVVGSVNFMGAHPKLSSFEDLDWNGSQAISGDPLVVIDNMFTEGSPTIYNDFYRVDISPDAVHKTGESGGEPISILLPNASFDALLLDGGVDWTGTFFIEYLRTCFAWGGFPGLRHNPKAAEAAREELAFLTEGLLPI